MGRGRGRPPKNPRGRPPPKPKNIAKKPIALSDSEGSDLDMPLRGGPKYPKDDDLIRDQDNADDGAGEGSGSGSEEDDDDVFVVEEIKQHLVDKDVRRLGSTELDMG